MVRLKDIGNLGVFIVKERFQFQNGTIKSHRQDYIDRFYYLFQFQNGTIKRYFERSFRTGNLQFQFQNGTIKS